MRFTFENPKSKTQASGCGLEQSVYKHQGSSYDFAEPGSMLAKTGNALTFRGISLGLTIDLTDVSTIFSRRMNWFRTAIGWPRFQSCDFRKVAQINRDIMQSCQTLARRMNLNIEASS